MQRPCFWRITLRSAEAEDAAACILNSGASGVEFLDDGSFRCYIQGSSSDCEDLIGFARECGCQLTALDPVPDENWCAACAGLWEKISIGKISIRPVPGPEGESAGADEILIIPGMGFGTGHHTATRLVLELMQRETITGKGPRTMLDIGTGSGILAIAGSKLFGCRTTAFDIDPLAMKNADDNVRLNRCEILMFVGDLPSLRPMPFDLIVANIYAEILINMHDQILKFASPDSVLIMSGIRSESAASVEEIFMEDGWTLIERKDEDGWTALMMGAPKMPPPCPGYRMSDTRPDGE